MRTRIVLATLALGMAPPASAALMISVQESGANVVANIGGSLNVDGLTATGSQYNVGLIAIFPSINVVFSGGDYTIYSGLIGPAGFGTGANILSASSFAGDAVGIIYDFQGSFLAPLDYISGAPLSATMTFANQTLSSIGLTIGTYVYTLPNDTLTLYIGTQVPGSTVPEPASWAMLIAGFGLVGAAMRRRKAALAA